MYSSTTMNLLLGAFVAVVVAGAFIATTTHIALWKYLLGVIRLLMFVLAGLTNRAQSQ